MTTLGGVDTSGLCDGPSRPGVKAGSCQGADSWFDGLATFRFGAHCELKPDVAQSPKSAGSKHGSLFDHLVGAGEQRLRHGDA